MITLENCTFRMLLVVAIRFSSHLGKRQNTDQYQQNSKLNLMRKVADFMREIKEV